LRETLWGSLFRRLLPISLLVSVTPLEELKDFFVIFLFVVV
jgi:hypothetical protein